MRALRCLFLLMLIPLSTMAKEALTSPDGKYCFTLEQKEGRLKYSVTYSGSSIITDGELGFEVGKTDIATCGISLKGVERTSANSTWRPVYGENSSVRDRYKQMTLHFSTATSCAGVTAFDITVRAYDEGVALRYAFPDDGKGADITISAERTTFPFDAGTICWHEARAQAIYNKVSLKTTESVWKDECERPLLLKKPDGTYVAVGEAALYDYARGKLKLLRDNVLATAMTGEAVIKPPYQLPWRVIMAGKKATDLINANSIFMNLNAPCAIDYTSWIKPGTAFRITRLNMKAALEAVDFAVERGIDYVEIDAGWYGPERNDSSSALAVAPPCDIDMPRLCSYAHERGIGVWLYVNQRALTRELDSILPLYSKWGVSGIKFGFVYVGPQRWTTWLHQAVRKCAAYRLMVDIHDEYRPTGWSRTYPNLLTQEGIRGNEEMPDAWTNTVHPFTRFLCGGADYTACYFTRKLYNTYAHQLTIPIVYYSPLTFLYWYDTPDKYHDERELDLWSHCPTVWDESRALCGEPGEYIVMARRSGRDWYVGAMNGLEGRDVTIQTSQFLKRGRKYKAVIYADDPSLNTRTNVSTTTREIRGGDELRLPLLPSGGAAVVFRR